MASNGGRIDFTIGYKVDKASLEQVKNELNQLSQISRQDFAKMNPTMNSQQVTASFKQVQSTIKEVKKAYDSAFDPTTGVNNINKLTMSLNKIGFNNIAKNFKQLGAEGIQTFNNMGRQILSTNLKFKETNNLVDRIGKTLGNTVRWSIASTLVNNFTGAVQQAYGYVQHLDTSLNDIRIVTGKSADEMDKFAEKANEAAKGLGASTTEYTEAALIYYQQGLSDEESQARAETTLKAANVTGQTGREVSEELTAVWNGYKVTAEETEKYVDKLAAVAASTASDLEELSTGMSKVASAANNMGVDVDQLNGMLSTIISTTRQAPETAGTALKTIFARIEDLKISGEDENGVKLGDVSGTLDEVGVHIMDVNGNMRDLGEIIEEVGNKWEGWTRAQQTAIAQAIAGKRQYNNLLALFDSWESYNTAVETSRNSLGTLQEQQDIYMESTEAHLQQLKTEWEDLYDSLLDTKDINSLVDVSTSLLDKFTMFIDAIGGGKGVLLGFGATALNVFNKQISINLSDTIQKFINARENAKLLNQEVNRIANIKNIDKTTETFQTLYNLKQQQFEHIDLMTKEEIQEMDTAIDQVIDLYAKKDKLTAQEEERLKLVREEIKETENLISTMAKAQVGTKGIAVVGTGGKAAQNIDIENNKGVEESQKTIQYAEKILEKNGAVAQSWEEVKQKFNDFNDAISQGKAANQLTKDINKLEGEFEKLLKQSGLNGELQNRFDSLFKSYHKFVMGGSKNTFGIERMIKAFDKDFAEAIEKTKKKLEETKQKIPELEKSIHETAQKAKKDIEDTGAAAKQMRNDLQQSFQTLNLREAVSGLTTFASGLTSVAFAFQSIKNLGNIWSQEDVSLGEKITQTMMNLGMVIPNVINAVSNLSSGWSSLKNVFSKFPQLLNTIQVGMVAYASGMSSVASAKKLLNNLSDSERNTLLQNIGLQNLEVDTLTEQDAELIINAHLKETNGDATQLLGEKSLFAAGANKTLGNALKFVKSPAGAVTIALLAVAAAAFAVNKAEDAAAKRVAEASKKQVEAAQKQVEATQQHLEAVKQLTQEYDNLKESYSDDNIEELRKKVYDLCQQYKVQIDMLRLMKANYEELQQIIDDLNTEALVKANEATLDSINKQSQYLIDNSKQIEAETIGTFNHFYLILSKIASLEFPWLEQFSNFNKYSLHMNSIDSVSKIVSTDIEGKIQIDWDKYYAASEEEQKQVEEYLENTYEGFLGSIWGIFDKSGQAALKAIRENKENQDKIEEQKQEYNKTRTDEIYSTEFADIEITNASDYNDTKEQLAERIKTDLEITEKESLELAEEKLAASDNAYTVKTAITVGTELAPSYSMSAEEVADKYNELSTVEQNFVSENLNLASSYKNLDDFIDTYHDLIERENNNQEVLNVGIALTNSDGKEFKPEDLDKLFSTEGFEQSLGKSREEFEAESYEQQTADLSIYYIKANQLENDFQQNKLQHLQEENNARQQVAEHQINQLEGIKDSVLQQFEGVEESDLFEGVANNLEQQLQDALNDTNFQQDFDFLEGSDSFDITETLEAAIDPSKELNECQERYIEILKEKNGYDDEDIKLLYNKLQANKEYQKELKNSNLPDEIKNTKSYSKAIDKLRGKSLELAAAYKKLGKSSIDWNAWKQNVEYMKKSTDSAIDSLQGAYSSLTSIMEEYNETQTLSMDNLQSLLNMDTAYLSALHIENGQMTLNEESLKQIALAKLDEAEAEAYAQAMEELHNETTRQGIQDQANAKVALANYGAAATNAAEAARAGVDDWKAYWDAALNREGVDNDAYNQQVGNVLRTKLQAINQVRQQIMNGNFGSTMKGPSKGSTSTKEADHEDYLEREVDLYREVNEQLEQIESTLGRIQKENSYKWGKDLQKGLERENKLLDQQLDKLKQKAEIQRNDIAQRRANLEAQGVQFSKDGSSMKNAESVLDKLYAEYNSMVDQYNSMSADQQKEYKKQLEDKKKDIDKTENDLKNYESLFGEYQSLLDELQELHYKQIENEVERFNNMVDVHLELDEAKKEWNDFWYEVVQDVDDSDFGGKIAQSMGKLKTLTGLGEKAEKSQIGELTTHLNQTTEEVYKQIQSRKRGGEDSIFEEASKLSKENLEKYRDQLMDAVREAKEEVDSIGENYLKILDSAQDKIDKQVEGLDAITDHLEHNIDLIKTVSGENAYGPILKQYEQLYQNDLKLLNTQRQSKEFWAGQIERYRTLLASTEENTVQWKTYSEGLVTATNNYRKAVGDLEKQLQDTLKRLDEARTKRNEAIYETLDKALSAGKGLDVVEEEWKLINDLTSRYLDNVERAIEIELYSNDLEEAANAIGLSAENQAKLNKFRDEELKKLSEKNKLTQYDIDESRARLAILQAEIALEDQRANKSKMRLRRDSQGNYSYQYVGDEDAEDEAENGVLTAKKEWYELVKKRNKEVIDYNIELRKQYSEYIKQANEEDMNNNHEKAEELRALAEQVKTELMQNNEEINKNSQDLISGTAQFFADVEQASVLPTSSTTAAHLINDMATVGEAGKQAISDLQASQNQYVADTEAAIKEAGINYQELVEEGIDPTNDALLDLVDSQEELDEALDNVNSQLTTQENNLKACESAYLDLKDAAVEAISTANAALEELANTAIETQQEVAASVAAAQAAASAQPVTIPSGGTGDGSGESDQPVAKVYQQGESANNSQGKGNYYLTINGKRTGQAIRAEDQADAVKKFNDDLKKKKINATAVSGYATYATGGYTGDWSTSDGKLAVLHQKELVLNESDTSNLLKAITMLRNVVASINVGGLADSLVNSTAQWMNSMSAQLFGNNGISNISNVTNDTNNYKSMVVNADFSGVRSADAIYQALVELENYGMQQNYSTAPHASKSY